jgi:hypothetical protein
MGSIENVTRDGGASDVQSKAQTMRRGGSSSITSTFV